MPPGATVVGIPARVVREAAEPSAAVAAIAKKMGFGWAFEDMPDPVANAMSTMFDHIQQLDEQLVKVCRLLHEVDSRMPELQLSKLELPDFCVETTPALDSLAGNRHRNQG